MRIVYTKDYQDMSRKAANLISAQIIIKPDSVIGLATGSTPIGAYRQLVEWYNKGDIDFSEATSINLDEYVGLDPLNEQSYRYFMNDNLFKHVNIRIENTHVPNGLEPDAEKECARYDALINRLGPIDLQLLGLGQNGHIGFNEPSDSFTADSNRTRLSDSTVKANRRFFDSEDEVPKFAYTVGIRAILQAKHIVLIASGEQKAEAVKNMICGSITPQFPASILQLHNNVTLVADEAALSLVPYEELGSKVQLSK